METVVSEHSSPDRVTLVLGGGWKLGCAFHAGVLRGLHDAWGLDARTVESVIGTSSGAVVGGLLGAGMSPDDLYCRESADDLSSAGQALMDRLGNRHDTDRPASPKRQPMSHRTLGLSARGALAALLPRGRQSMASLEQYFDDLIGPEWPTHTDLRFCAVDLGSGQRVALDRDCGATVGQAVAASCSVPGISQPVVIRGREYVDGAVYSINNADLARATSDDSTDPPVRQTVVVSAPLSVSQLRVSLGPMGLLRNALHLQTMAETYKLRHIDQLIVLEPNAADVAAMGRDMNNGRRRAIVAESSYAHAMAVLDAIDAPTRTASQLRGRSPRLAASPEASRPIPPH